MVTLPQSDAWKLGYAVPYTQRPMAERWASFDCYGTLIDWNRGLAGALAALLPSAGRDELLAAYHQAEPRIQAEGALPYRDVLARAARATAAQLGLPLPPGAEEAVPASLPAWPPFPETAEALSELRARGWKLAVLSNTDPELLAASLSAIGVPVDLSVTVAEAGSYKPARGHWDAFRERTGAEDRGHVHVAASLFHDIEPCATLGIRAVWINRLGESSDLARAGELADLRGLASLLEQLAPPHA